ncbi:MAG: acetyl-coenzyme A synthetase N-terminal domain-containing protein, partial [Nitrososphaeraceae archaeon]|nr:acetyl-coenzyme A synthetase N-terminal domain-containing protein [Nitrososphaeraceae archaeon]
MSENLKIDGTNYLNDKDFELKSFKPPPEFKKAAHISSFSQYKSIYEFSKSDPERFWSSEAKELKWFKPWKEIKKGTASATKWFVGGKTNITYNCIDRFIQGSKKNKAAIIWEGENSETRVLTYQLLHTYVCKLANALKMFGINKNDTVLIYMGA